VEAIVAAVYDTSDYMLLLYRDSHALQPASIKAVLARADTFYRMVRDVVEQAVLAGQADVVDFDDAANLVTHLPTLFAVRRWRFRAKRDRGRMIASATSFILRGLGVTAAQAPARRPALRRHNTTIRPKGG
jgi:hypothetical protein